MRVEERGDVGGACLDARVGLVVGGRAHARPLLLTFLKGRYGGTTLTLLKGMSMADPNALNATQGSLLGFLHDGPRTGWELLQQAQRSLARFWNVTPSHVYRELKALEERGLVAAGERGPRDRRPFTISAAGADAFAQWIASEPGPEQIRVPLLVTLWFGRHLPADRLAAIVAAQETMHAQRLAEYRAIASETSARDPHVDAVVQFGIAYEEAFLHWLDALPRAVARRRMRG